MEKLNLKNQTKTNSKGITLIALVVTIIVLLILAAIVLLMLTGNDGILSKAGEAKQKTEIATEKETIQLAITELKTNRYQQKDYTRLKKSEIDTAISNNFTDKNIQISDRRIGEKYVYIVKVNNREYGILEDNTVEYLKPAIRNQYIEINKVEETNPTFLFQNTITQEMVDSEVGQINSSYEVVGVSAEENGEYISTGTIDGKSGVFNIIDLENATFEYTLNNFLLGDECIFVKLLINGSILV